MPYPYRYQTVIEALSFRSAGELKSAARLIDERPGSLKKDQVVQLIASRMSGRSLAQLIRNLSSVEKAAVLEAAHSESFRFDRTAFDAKWGTDSDAGGELSSLDRYWGDSLLSLFIYNGSMPVELGEKLSTFLPKPPEDEIASCDELPKLLLLRNVKDEEGNPVGRELSVYESIRPAFHELVAVLRLIGAGKIRVSEKTKLPTKGSLGAINEVLYSGDYHDCYEPEFIRPFAWPMLMQEAKLARREGTKLKLSKKGENALANPDAEVIQSIFNQWRGASFDEFSRIDAIKGQKGRRTKMTPPEERRESIIQTLYECPAGKWIELDEFFRFVQSKGNDFWMCEDLFGLYIGHQEYGSLGYAGYTSFSTLRGRYILVFFMEYLATLGLLDIALLQDDEVPRIDPYLDDWLDYSPLSRYDDLWFFRINELGSYCLEFTETFVPPEPEKREILTLMPNLDIAVSAQVVGMNSELQFLARFSEKTSDYVYRLDKNSILTAAEQGHSIEDVRAFLQTNSSGEMPGTVSRFLSDIEDRLKKLKWVRRCHLFEASDPVTAQLILNDSKLRRFCLQAGEKYILIPEAKEAEFRKGLKALGYAWMG
jgi:hypothetical protein